MKLRLTLGFLFATSPALALDLSLPGGSLTAQVESPADSVRLPRQAWSPGTDVSGTEGAIRRSVYVVQNPAMTTLQLIDPVRTVLEEDGYKPVFTCADAACGGFDFRFQLDLLPAPDMYVDLGNYRYVLMEKPGAAPHSVALLASSSTTAGFLHVTEVGAAYLPEVIVEEPKPVETAPEVVEDEQDRIAILLDTGHVVLSDLEFATGSAELGPGPYMSLQELAGWLSDTPGARVVLVGHTDSVGSLEANTSLSRRRAQSVLERLTTSLGVDPAQVAADGAGALSPLASNLEEDGRAANRRVEVVLLAIE